MEVNEGPCGRQSHAPKLPSFQTRHTLELERILNLKTGPRPAPFVSFRLAAAKKANDLCFVCDEIDGGLHGSCPCVVCL